MQPEFRLIGTTLLDRYRVTKPLGQGGMGVVFEALDTQTGGMVAVKVLGRAARRSARDYRRFHREAQTAALLGSPHAAEVFAVSELPTGEPFFVMERLVGETLRACMDRMRIGERDAIGVVVQLLSALAAVHARGIVHRDIKPENVFLTRDANGNLVAKLIDFGVAKLTEAAESDLALSRTSLTQTGVVVGTVAYLSPEQIAHPRTLDPRTDLWACGVVLYEALTRTRPFHGDSPMSLMLDILNRAPVSPRQIAPQLSVAVENVVMTALRKRPDHRFPTAESLRDALLALYYTTPPPSDPLLTQTDVDIPVLSAVLTTSTEHHALPVHRLPPDIAELLTSDEGDDDKTQPR